MQILKIVPLSLVSFVAAFLYIRYFGYLGPASSLLILVSVLLARN